MAPDPTRASGVLFHDGGAKAGGTSTDMRTQIVASRCEHRDRTVLIPRHRPAAIRARPGTSSTPWRATLSRTSPFDLDTSSPCQVADPVPVVEGCARSAQGHRRSEFARRTNGTLVYARRPGYRRSRPLVWVDRRWAGGGPVSRGDIRPAAVQGAVCRRMETRGSRSSDPGERTARYLDLGPSIRER